MSNFQKISDKTKWQELLRKTLFQTFFHKLEWEEFLENQFSWLKFERYLWNNQLLLSFVRIKQGSKTKLISHPFCEYGGPLPLQAGIDAEQFQRELEQNLPEKFKISFHPFLLSYFVNARELINKPAERESFFLKNLGQKTEKELWLKCLDRNRRRSIKKAQEAGIVIEELKTERELKKLYQFYALNLKKHCNIAYPFSFFQFFYQKAQEGRAMILLAKKHDENLGGNIFLFYNNICHSFLCGFKEKEKELGLHSLVLWQMIKRAKERAIDSFDLGATQKNSPLREFKTRWGAEPLPIVELKNFQTGSRLRQSRIRRMWRFLPLGLARFLSPYLLKRRF